MREETHAKLQALLDALVTETGAQGAMLFAGEGLAVVASGDLQHVPEAALLAALSQTQDDGRIASIVRVQGLTLHVGRAGIIHAFVVESLGDGTSAGDGRASALLSSICLEAARLVAGDEVRDVDGSAWS